MGKIVFLKVFIMNRVIKGNELAGLIHNVLYADLDERGFVTAHRFTDKQIERYAVDSSADGVDYTLRCRATSNVTIEFTTDSSFVALFFEWHEAVGISYVDIDCMVDGKLFHHFFDEKLTHKFFAFEMPEGTHDVCIFLPWNTLTPLKEMIIEEGAFIKPVAKKPLRILSFGDSITQGYVGRHPAMTYVGRMTSKLNAEVLNQAIGGYYFVGASLDSALSSWNPDLITVAYGTNDFSVKASAQAFEDGMRGFMERLTEIFPDVPVLGIMPIYRNDIAFNGRKLMRDYTHERSLDIIREVYAEYKNVTLMEDTFYPHCSDFFYTDFLHPNDIGGLIYGDAVAEKIREMGF